MVNQGLLVNNPTEHCKATQWFFRTALLGNSDGMLSPSKVLQEHGDHAVIQNWLQRVGDLGDPRHRCPDPGQEHSHDFSSHHPQCATRRFSASSFCPTGRRPSFLEHNPLNPL